MADKSPPKSSMGRKALKALFSLLRIIVVTLLMLAWFQRSLIYHPTKATRLAAKDVSILQAVVDVTVPATETLTLHGWLELAGAKRSAGDPNIRSLLDEGRPLVIIFPGNAGNRQKREHLLATIGGLGADAMIFDYRGYGDNAGSPTEANFAHDARCIWKYATEELKVPANRIVLYGESLGGGTAARLAGDLGKEGIEPGGLILQSTFNSLVDTGRYHFPYLPVNLILIDRFDSQKHVAHAKCPVLQLHGKQDEIVPLPLGQKLFDAVPQKSQGGISKEQVLFPYATHNDVFIVDAQLAIDALRRFLNGVSERASTTVRDQ